MRWCNQTPQHTLQAAHREIGTITKSFPHRKTKSQGLEVRLIKYCRGSMMQYDAVMLAVWSVQAEKKSEQITDSLAYFKEYTEYMLQWVESITLTQKVTNCVTGFQVFGCNNYNKALQVLVGLIRDLLPLPTVRWHVLIYYWGLFCCLLMFIVMMDKIEGMVIHSLKCKGTTYYTSYLPFAVSHFLSWWSDIPSAVWVLLSNFFVWTKWRWRSFYFYTQPASSCNALNEGQISF